MGEITNISEDNIIKITNSLKTSKDITNVKYFEKSEYNDFHMYIYDEDDLENASKELGFKPTFIKNLNDKVIAQNVSVCNIDDDKNALRIEYSAPSGEQVVFMESKYNDEYNDIKNGKLVVCGIGDNSKPSKSEKITINDKEVYKIKEKANDTSSDLPTEYRYIYAWEDNGVYYKAISISKEESFDKDFESYIKDFLSK